MARHFVIRISVAYDEAHGRLDDIKDELLHNVYRCVDRGELLNDSNLEAVVEDWSCTVEEGTA